MKNQSLLQQKFKKLKEIVREIEQLTINDKSIYAIVAGWGPGHLVTGLQDTNGRFIPSGHKAVNSPELQELEWSDKFRLICKGIYQAIGMIPPTQLAPYLEEDGPRIILKLSAAGLFNVQSDEKILELKETMKEHIKNYRIQIETLTEEEFEELLEIE